MHFKIFEAEGLKSCEEITQEPQGIVIPLKTCRVIFKLFIFQKD